MSGCRDGSGECCPGHHGQCNSICSSREVIGGEISHLSLDTMRSLFSPYATLRHQEIPLDGGGYAKGQDHHKIYLQSYKGLIGNILVEGR